MLAARTPPADKRPILLSIGEPRHPTPPLVLEALARSGAGLANYPMTVGPSALREAIASWLARRHGLPTPDPATQVLPVLGSREALFAFTQTIVDGSRPGATVAMPNPFYQIYEGGALLAGAGTHLSTRRRAWLRARLVLGARRGVGAHATAFHLLAGQPDRPGDHAGGVARAVRPLRPPRVRHRVRRMLFRDLLRRRPAAAVRARRRRAPRGATTTATCWSSAASPSARMRRDCARAMSPATRAS